MRHALAAADVSSLQSPIALSPEMTNKNMLHHVLCVVLERLT